MIPIKKAIDVARHEGIWPLSWKFLKWSHLYDTFWNTITSRYEPGTNIFTRDWDLLVILDSCRPDSLSAASTRYSYISNINRMTSMGSMSAEWMLKTFCKNHLDLINSTVYISGNVWSERIFKHNFHKSNSHSYEYITHGLPKWSPVTEDDFYHYEFVSAEGNNGKRLHPQNEAVPHILTDRAIDVGRKQDHDRMIVHYTLPHLTFIADAVDWEPGASSITELMSGLNSSRPLRPEEKSYDPAILGDVTVEQMHKIYQRNIKLALEYVSILISNIEADRVVITADHGEALGEHGIWGHPYGYPLPEVKTVPWAVTTARDDNTYEPKFDSNRSDISEEQIDSFLENMGYK